MAMMIRYKYYDCDLAYKTFEETRVGFREVSKMFAFDDCGPGLEDLYIEVDGKEVRYCGWQPCMKYEYKFVDTDETIFTGYYEEWDH